MTTSKYSACPHCGSTKQALVRNRTDDNWCIDCGHLLHIYDGLYAQDLAEALILDAQTDQEIADYEQREVRW